METLCLAEFQDLLIPVREVAMMASVLLPRDANPVAVENYATNGRKKRSGY